jgi:hypothetical protein
LYSYQKYIRVPALPHPHQHLLMSSPLIMTIPTGLRWNLSVVLICVSFITREVFTFSCLYWPFVPLPLKISLFNSCAHFYIGVLILWGLSFLSSLKILDISSISLDAEPFDFCLGSFSVFPTASWSCFKVSGLILRSLIHSELILVQGERQLSSFSLLHVDIQFFQ